MENYTVEQMISLSWVMLKEEWQERGPTKHFLHEFLEEFSLVQQLQIKDVLIVLAIAVLFTIHRFFTTIFFIKPLSRYLQILPKDENKFIESVCRFIYYWTFFLMEYYLVIVRYPEFRYDPASQWKDWKFDMAIPDDIRYLYYLESGFYFHALYATVFMDVWKKDSIAMLIHHVLANALIIFSMATRYHRIGLVVLYLHDSADVFLEGTKTIISIKNKYNFSALEILTGIGFLSFASNWAWCRLLVYPQVVLFSSMHVARTIIGHKGKFYFLFNGMLAFLYGLNLYWFHFILMLIIRLITGKSKGVEDTREFDQNPKTNANGVHQNGLTKSHENGYSPHHEKSK